MTKEERVVVHTTDLCTLIATKAQNENMRAEKNIKKIEIDLRGVCK